MPERFQQSVIIKRHISAMDPIELIAERPSEKPDLSIPERQQLRGSSEFFIRPKS